MTPPRIWVFACVLTSTLACGGSSPAPTENRQPERPPGVVLDEVPEIPDQQASYLIYLHGAIVESQGMRPTHPRFGPYEYPAILEAFADRGFVVISEARAAGTRPEVFARRLSLQIQELVDSGVPDEQITVVGFSKGSVIAILSSAEIHYPGINWVFQAGCGPWIDKMPKLVPHGRVLSLFDQADDLAQSCTGLFDRMPETAVTQEKMLDLGTAHGAFYSPNPAWMEPTVAWAGL